MHLPSRPPLVELLRAPALQTRGLRAYFTRGPSERGKETQGACDSRRTTGGSCCWGRALTRRRVPSLTTGAFPQTASSRDHSGFASPPDPIPLVLVATGHLPVPSPGEWVQGGSCDPRATAHLPPWLTRRVFYLTRT